MPNAMRAEGIRGRLLVGGVEMGTLQHWKMEQVGHGRYTFEADRVAFDEVYWPFRNYHEPIVVELPFKRSTMRFRVTLSGESPLIGEAILDADTAEEAGEFW